MRCEFCEKKVNVLVRGLCNNCIRYLEEINEEKGGEEKKKIVVIIEENGNEIRIYL